MDWPQLIKELQDAGVTQAQIAEKAGLTAVSAVSDLANGKTKRPSWDLGEAVRLLHTEHCPHVRGKKAVGSDRRAITGDVGAEARHTALGDPVIDNRRREGPTTPKER
jgi:hypothetical protein